VMVDHGDGNMTLYANLSSETATNGLTKGQKIKAGTFLGNALDRFYFEVRQAGNALDPRMALAPSEVAKIAL
jgi:septal ring factor EnvC (AmiA/AmiB activator)